MLEAVLKDLRYSGVVRSNPIRYGFINCIVERGLFSRRHALFNKLPRQRKTMSF